MIQECIDCGSTKIEANGLCAVCASRRRKEERLDKQNALKKPSFLQRAQKPIAKTSPKQQAINRTYSQSLKKRYQDAPKQKCAGCGEPATCTAHIIAKSRLKLLGRPELISDPRASFPSCYACNLAIENPKGQGWKGMANIDECLEFIKKNDPELHRKFMVNL